MQSIFLWALPNKSSECRAIAPASSLRGAQRRRNPFIALAATSLFVASDQRQCLEQGA
ncbi:MAG: hypothetical protein HON78_01210 [Legionellales bacterium]|nr:hypothetical protein [Legionellales bacterium]